MRAFLYSYVQPAMVALVILFWAFAPATWVEAEWTSVIVVCVVTFTILGLEFVAERHSSWRLNWKEFTTDLFYLVLNLTVIGWLATNAADNPLRSLKEAAGISTPWALAMPFLLQVALVIFLIEFGQYWMHRLMHWNPFFWSTHAPHHHITQLNAMKGAIGNPLELFLISLSVVSFFDLELSAILCAVSILAVVSSFAHANVRMDPPRWYAYFFTTIRNHSLHHSVAYEDTRCNYANSLIVLDRIFGTYREGESEMVGQDERRRLSIYEQFVFPLNPAIAAIKARREKLPFSSN